MVIPSRFTLIASGIASEHGVTLESLREKNQLPSLVAIRREIAIALRTAGASYRETGLVLGRDPTTIIYLVKAKARAEARFRVA